MKSLFCRINIHNTINNSNFEDAVNCLSEYSGTKKDILTNNNEAFGHLSFSNVNKEIYRYEDYLIIADSRIDNKPYLIKELSLEDDEITDDLIILKAYLKWGVDCTKHLIGDFAFVIKDFKKEELYCARDHLGLKPLYYYFDDNSFIISSEIKAILTQNDLSFIVDKQYLADSLSIIKSEHYRTFYNEIKKLPPAHFLSFKNGKIKQSRYWDLKNQKESDLSYDEAIEKFKELIFEAVRCRTKTIEGIGTELSGGLDSSSIAAVASTFTDLSCFSHVMPEAILGKIYPRKDEREFIKNVTDFCSIKKSYFINSEKPGLFKVFNDHIAVFNHLTQQHFSTFSDQLYKEVSEKNINVLLSGFGGDEVITSKSGNYLEEMAAKKYWKTVIAEIKEINLSRYSRIKKLITLKIKIQFPRLYHTINRIKKTEGWWVEKYKNLALNQEFINTMQIEKRYLINYEKVTQYMSLQARNIERITHTHVSQRLEYSNTSARKYGIEYRYPFLDKRLIEFYMSLPTRLKARNGIKRYAIREAMRGILPEDIRMRNDKSGATIPTVLNRFLMDADKFEKLILESENTIANRYIDFVKFKDWFAKMKNQEVINPGGFYTYLKLLFFIKTNPDLFKDE